MACARLRRACRCGRRNRSRPTSTCGDCVGGGVRVGLGLAIGEHAGAAIGKIRRRKARRERQRRDRVALQLRQLLIDAFAGLVVCALPTDRDQERHLPERFGEAPFGSRQQREMARGGAAGVGHVDMRIGAIGDQRVGMFDHRRRDIGVQIEADDQGNVGADRLAHPAENSPSPSSRCSATIAPCRSR